MTYIDGFLIAIAKDKVPEYRKMARKAAKIWKEHGALEYRETVADDLSAPDEKGNIVSPFAKTLRLKDGETAIFSWVVYQNKAARNKANKQIMQDPRILKMMQSPMPYDTKRFCYGGFKTIVEM